MEILTANELLSGAVVYFDRAGHWVTDFTAARTFDASEAEARDAAISAAKASGRIVGVEIETVKVVDGRIVADRLRERIRAQGPTAPYGPDRQNLGVDHVSL